MPHRHLTLEESSCMHQSSKILISNCSLKVFGDIQGVSRLQGITAGGGFLGLCDEKGSYKHVSDFGQLRSYDRLKLRIEGNDY